MIHHTEACQSAIEILDNIRRVKGESHYAACAAVFNLQSAQILLKNTWKEATQDDKDMVETQMACAIMHLCAGLQVELEDVLSDLKPVWARFTN